MRRENSILGLSKPEKKLNFLICYTYEHVNFHAQLSMNFFFIILEPDCCCCCIVVLRPGKHLLSYRDGQLT